MCGYSVYYFIALIIECYLLSPLLIRHNNVKTLVLVILLSLVTTLLVETIRFGYGNELPLVIRGSFPVLLIFFYLGIYLTSHSRDYSLWIPVVMMIVGLGGGLMQMQLIRDYFGISAQGQKITLYIFDAGFILLCMSKKCELLYRKSLLTRVILYVGEISFGIYFTHIYMIWIADRFFPQMRGSWLVLWLFSIFLSIGFIAMMKRVAPEYSKKYLGYR